MAGTNDITMARKGILNYLPSTEKIIADKGYRGEAQIISPIFRADSPKNRVIKKITARHKAVNKSIKDWKCSRSLQSLILSLRYSS